MDERQELAKEEGIHQAILVMQEIFLNARKQLDGVQSIMNEQQVDNLHNNNMTNEVLDDKHEKDGQQAKEMEATVDSNSGIVVDDVGVSMQSKELSKGKDKVSDGDWTAVTHKQGMWNYS
ncbi:hypothetical protein K7X08_036403 [Anisodus acutangulus]|uniref:Uncharacterized protein n=1 Tax=Anisodus acutangulus TaxID=402998 RepID=A0A9Q1L576_9SOLA|nr:hypothetical protein K7X08_036403 [Anisodus acutangulus]